MGFLLERFEEITMGTKTVLMGNGVFENGLPEGHKSECHISTEENESSNGREISGPVRKWVEVDDGEKGDLRHSDSGKKSENINRKNWLFGESGVRVKNERNKKCENEK